VTLDQILQAVQKYEKRLQPEGIRPERCSKSPDSSVEALNHVSWMIGEIRKQVAAQETEKAMRWLGFVQGVLWTNGVFTIDEMRDDNR
jgi:hypothetical protein